MDTLFNSGFTSAGISVMATCSGKLYGHAAGHLDDTGGRVPNPSPLWPASGSYGSGVRRGRWVDLPVSRMR